MLCDGCKQREAGIVLHMVTNGQVATRSLCADCAHKAHMEMNRAFNTMGMQMEGLQGMVEQQAQEKIRIPRMMCSSCRTAIEAIEYSTILGCAQCYGAFESQVVDYLSDVKPQDSQREQHTDPLAPMPVLSAAELDARLQEALRAENFERAAELRDQIRALARELPDA